MTIVPNATLIFQAVTFLVLMVILDKMLFKPVLRILEERKARTEGRRENAAEADKQAETIWEDYQTKIAQARSEAESIRAELVKQGEAERQLIVDEASAEAAKTVAKVRESVRADAEAASATIKAEVEGLASTMAEKILGRAV